MSSSVVVLVVSFGLLRKGSHSEMLMLTGHASAVVNLSKIEVGIPILNDAYVSRLEAINSAVY